MLLRYQRTGGRVPRDDEALEVAPDGTWAARRTVAGYRIGRFAGRLPDAALAAFAREAAAAAAAGDAEVPTPRDGATETLDVDRASIQLGSNERAPGAWRPLVEHARRFVRDEVPEAPVAGLALEADETTARLVHAGTEPVEIDPGSIEVRVMRLDADGLSQGTWTAGAGGGADSGWTRAGTGWALDLPFGHGLAPVAGEFLQVRVLVRVRDDRVRSARLYVVVRVADGTSGEAAPGADR